MKKIYCKLISIECKVWKSKFLRRMRIVALLLLIGITQTFALNSYSQTTRLSLNFENETIINILDKIENQSEFYFMFDLTKIDLYQRKSINCENQPITTILDQLLEDTHIIYEISDRQIVLFRELDMESEQQKAVSGKVSDPNGQPLPGVSVTVEGTTQGTVTSADGEYSLTNIPEDATLVFSFVGMLRQEVIVGSQATINITMREDVIGIEEVVTVGYGTQRKVNLTGSVSSVSSDILSERVVNNASNLLQGRVAGLQVIQPSGQPGMDDAKLQIRGLGSFGASSAPLVLIDGIMGSLSDLAPSDIENISVLKDAASASIYGSRAANGVILVTTKQGTKGINIEYKFEIGLHSATNVPEGITNSAEYMRMANTAYSRSGIEEIYTQEQINAYANAVNDPQYPNFDWLDYYFKTATVFNHTFSLSNVTDKSSFRFSLNYLDQDGIINADNIKSERFNALMNYSSQLTKGIKIGTNIRGVYKNTVEPPWPYGEFTSRYIFGANPLYMPYLPDGSGRKTAWAYPSEGHNVSLPILFTNGAQYYKDYRINAKAFMEIDLFKGLTWQINAGVNYSNDFHKYHAFATKEHYMYHKLPGEDDYQLNEAVSSISGSTALVDTYNLTIIPTIYSVLDYKTQISNSHNINAMVGYEQQSMSLRNIKGSKQSFPTIDLMELDAGAASGQTVGGNLVEWALRSYFSRLSYNFKGKYLLEANVRYDGTSRVAEKNRWGFFPSASAGWRISEENFVKNNLKWLDNLKLRGSYGVLGNQEIGNYPFQDILSIVNYPYGSNLTQGVWLTAFTDKNLQWESTRILDVGFDMDISKGLLGITFDMFKKNTFDILSHLPVPNSLGLSGPITNNGELENKGWELELRHSNQIGELTYRTYFLISTYKNKLVSIVAPTKGVREVGLPYNSFYIYEMEGIFQSQQDIDNSATHIFYTPKPGDIKIKNQNGDNVIDEKDRISISPYPEFTYSFGFDLGWRRFNLSAFFQGVQGVKTELNGWGFDPLEEAGFLPARFRDAWSPTNPSNTLPGLYAGGSLQAYPGVYAYPSTYHLQDASYLRLKSVNLTYDLPKKFVNKLKLKGLMLQISGDNLLTFTKFEGLDPEMNPDRPSDEASVYPQVRILSAGVKVNF